MTDPALQSSFLGATAFWTAAVRAHESMREDRLFDDPWAAALAGEEGLRWLGQRGATTIAIVIRTRYFDEFLLHLAEQDGIRQVVLMAAGLDTRAFRLSWPAGTRLFELDLAPVLEHKARVLAEAGAQPQCQRVAIPVDLAAPWADALNARRFDPQASSAWLLEGLTFYLPNETTARLLEDLSGLAAPGSRIGFDVVNSLTLTSPITKPWVDMQATYGAPWIGTFDDPEGYLGRLGWSVSLSQPGAEDANYGRWTLPIIPLRAPNLPHNWYITGRKEKY